MIIHFLSQLGLWGWFVLGLVLLILEIMAPGFFFIMGVFINGGDGIKIVVRGFAEKWGHHARSFIKRFAFIIREGYGPIK